MLNDHPSGLLVYESSLINPRFDAEALKIGAQKRLELTKEHPDLRLVRFPSSLFHADPTPLLLLTKIRATLALLDVDLLPPQVQEGERGSLGRDCHPPPTPRGASVLLSLTPPYRTLTRSIFSRQVCMYGFICLFPSASDKARARSVVHQLKASLALKDSLGSYANIESDVQGRAEVFYGRNWERLKSIKRKVDGEGVFGRGVLEGDTTLAGAVNEGLSAVV